MKKNGKNMSCDNGARHTKKWGGVLRSISMILCMLFVLTACVGCTTYASYDDVENLKSELDEALLALETLKQSYEVAKQEIDALEADREDMQEELDAVKKRNETDQQEIANLKESNQSAQEKINSLTESNQSAQQEIESLKGDNTTMRQEIDALKSNNAAALKEIERLKEQIQNLQNGTNPDEPNQKIKIYIDQGHNPTSYHNAGATGNGLYEQDLTFTIGILLAELLEADGRFEVCLSRPTATTVLGTDVDSSLEARVKGAQDFGADYFISLHINSHTTSTATGIEVYVAEENSVSYDFGNALLQGLLTSTNLNNRGMKIEPDFRVLKKATMPAALLEMGFISNSEDAALLSGSPDLFAMGIYNGILDYFDLTANATPTN